MITLALDLSTKSTGYAVFDNEKLIDYNCITAGSANLYNRIDKIIEGLDQILKKYKVDKVFIEDVYPEDVHKNNSVFKALMYLQGFVMHLLNKYNLTNKITFYIPSEWRKKCGIHTGPRVRRETLKAKDMEFVSKHFGIRVNDDTADAICIGCAGLGLVLPEVEEQPYDDFEFL